MAVNWSDPNWGGHVHTSSYGDLAGEEGHEDE
jgi:hypothetical protein